jgi:hypothetical protein
MNMKVPQNWSEITIGKYQDLISLEKSDDVIQQEIQILSALTGEPESMFEDMSVEDLKGLISKTAFLSDLPNSKKIPRSIKVAGKKFTINLMISDLSGGQYIDLMTLTKDGGKVIEKMHEILAIFIHPMERRFFMWMPVPYSGDKHRDTADFLKKNLTMDVAYPIAIFFCLLYENLMAGIQDYFLKKADKEISKAKRILKKSTKKKKPTSKNGDGL